jgi:ABC-type Fe3+-hydroxamate transport system substrate-binding protein
VTISGPGRSKQTITLTDSTTYRQAGARVSNSALVAGAQIVAQGSVDSSGNFTASSVTIAPSVVTGTVGGKTSSAITVTTAAGKTVTINVSSSTRYVVRGIRSATLADVAVGDRITAQGTLGSDGSLTATTVQVLPNGQRGPASSGGPGSGNIPTVPGASPSGPSV